MGGAVPGSESSQRVPLYLQILGSVALGIVVGLLLGQHAKPLGDLGLLVIRLLKALATPLILLAVLDAFVRTTIPAKKGATLLVLSAVNAVVAIALGLFVAHATGAGASQRDALRALAHSAHNAAGSHAAPAGEQASLDFFTNVRRYIPDNVVDPFRQNNVITVVLLTVLFGAGLRKLIERDPPELREGLRVLREMIHALFAVVAQVLEGVIRLIPGAVGLVVASLVGQTGLGVFRVLLPFLLTVLLGLALHAFGWYGILVAVVGKRSPRAFFSGASDAVVTALSCGSSLATLPVTLRCLQEKLRVSLDSARLAACVGTNLNHDGIILYEAAAAIFMSQAFGHELTLGQQVTVALSSVMAGVGIAGVPEAGLITLPLVLSSAGLPAEVTALAVPLILPVDWILGRCRAATNVLSDMTVATLLDRFHPPEANKETEASV